MNLLCLHSQGGRSLPHTTLVNTMGTSLLAMMLTRVHSEDQGCCSHQPLKCASQPHVPETSVWVCYGRIMQETSTILSGEECMLPLEILSEFPCVVVSLLWLWWHTFLLYRYAQVSLLW